MDSNLILIVSCGRRYSLLEKTINALGRNLSNITTIFKKVWIFDDKSSANERIQIEKLFQKWFDDNFNQINFNNREQLAFIDKFNFIRNVINEKDIVFFLEDDWELNTNFDILKHKERLELETEWDLISFTDPLDIQDETIQKKFIIDDIYWKNPYPEYYKHPVKWFENGSCFWKLGRMNNWTNNPALIKGSVYFKNSFQYERGFEGIFADSMKSNHVFTNYCYFNHIGYDASLIDRL